MAKTRKKATARKWVSGIPLRTTDFEGDFGSDSAYGPSRGVGSLLPWLALEHHGQPVRLPYEPAPWVMRPTTFAAAQTDFAAAQTDVAAAQTNDFRTVPLQAVFREILRHGTA